MKKTLTVALCVIGFVLFAGPIYIKSEVHPVLLNGKPFSKAFLINGEWALPMEDVIKGTGEITAEPSFKLQGNKLFAFCATGEHFKKAQVVMRTDTSSPVQKVQVTSVNKIKPTGRQLFSVNHDGVISTHVFMHEGKAYFPVADFVKAFGGGVFNPGTLNAGESINLTFTVNGDGIWGVQQ